jgi:CHAT domain-containing protein
VDTEAQFAGSVLAAADRTAEEPKHVPEPARLVLALDAGRDADAARNRSPVVWGLPRREAERLATLHTGGVLRGSEGTEKKPDKGKRIAYRGEKPFAHPYYWAGFTLIGDPD